LRGIQEELVLLKQRDQYLDNRWASCEYYSGRNRRKITRCRVENELYASKFIEILQRHPNQTTMKWYNEAQIKIRKVNDLYAQRILEKVFNQFKEKTFRSTPWNNYEEDLTFKREPQSYPNVRFQR
jgi:hypothetical protein